MPYILKIKEGDYKDQYVGRKGIRSWDWKPQQDPNNARVFASIAGIKTFHGKPTNEKIRAEIAKQTKELKIKIFGVNASNKEINTSNNFHNIRKFRSGISKIERDLCIPYTERYVVIEIDLSK